MVGLALVAPAVSLADWGLFGFLRARQGGMPLRLDWHDVLGPTWNTVWISVLTALVATVVVLPVAYLVTRHRSRLGEVVNAVVVAGFAIPGLVVALSMIFWTMHASPFEFLIGSMPVLVFAYVVHFGAWNRAHAFDGVLDKTNLVNQAGRFRLGGRENLAGRQIDFAGLQAHAIT